MKLARHQPCGCVVCICEDEIKCYGCGAKNCGTHIPGEIPNPVYDTTTPQREQASGTENIKRCLDSIDPLCDRLPDADQECINQARAELAALRDVAKRERLAGELEMRETACSHVPWSDGRCSCGVKYSDIATRTPDTDWTNHFRTMPLTPDSADVLKRIKRAERARGAEQEADFWTNHGSDALSSNERQHYEAVKQAAIADGEKP